MKTGNTGFLVVVVWLCLFISSFLAQEGDNMERNATASEKVVRQSQSLCDGEREFVQKRKQIVLETLNNLEINCTENSVPHIALLGSGGGQRAAVAMVGSLYQLEKDNLLDTLLYLAGVSGSTWSMASMYSDPKWSSNMDGAVSKLSGDGVELEEALAWLHERAKEKHFSLTDIWAVLTSAGIMKEMYLRRLSEEADRNATNPYPIYSAIEKQCFSDGPTEGKWFEISPHEAGFPALGLFVETSLLGSKFQSGELLEKKPEMDMVKLQGVLGSAIADEETVRDAIPTWLDVPEYLDSSAQKYLLVYAVLNKLALLTRGTITDPAALTYLDTIQKTLKDMVYNNQSARLYSKTSEERQDAFKAMSLELQAAVESWCEGLQDERFKRQVSAILKQVIPLIHKWEWGTTRNFLYQYQDPCVPPCLQTKDTIHLIDAGSLINVPYPSFLGDKRDIDLIIAPEYSAGNMFETLTLARNYSAELMKPFPEIDDEILKDRDFPKDCYVLEGGETAPTIIYMPLFNQQNCKDAEEFKAKMDEYNTFQLPYTQEKIDFVLETAKANMKNNRETLLREIKKAVLRREKKENPTWGQKLTSCLTGLL
ncbi:cytosolic phospholipase A2 zeta-like [Acanthochromis polyacanthus]|uniref:cytosolic phospholipase A2 zeta-like n=1 Tax=Acanthochromis polyacanthus TaxID=80966 RepID=UPI0022342109|nr:cytosolic phospholipase A2 zeta-like [Acanthochromis polyacanthus]